MKKIFVALAVLIGIFAVQVQASAQEVYIGEEYGKQYYLYTETLEKGYLDDGWRGFAIEVNELDNNSGTVINWTYSYNFRPETGNVRGKRFNSNGHDDIGFNIKYDYDYIKDKIDFKVLVVILKLCGMI